MALSAAVGSFLLTSGSTTNVAVSGLGFQPKALICWFNGRGGDGSTNAVGRQDHFQGMSFCVSTSSRRCIVQNSDDTAATSINMTRWQADAIALSIDFVTPATDGRADLSSFDSDGFTVSIPDAFPRDTRVAYLALGGSDITNTEVFETTDPGSNTTREVNLSGAFQPDLVLLMGPSNVGAPPSGTSSAGRFWFGAFTGTTDEHVICVGADGGSGTADTSSYHKTGEATAGMPATVGNVINSRATVTSIDPDGFTLTYTESAASALVFFGLAIKGGSFAVGDFPSRNTTGSIVETGLSFQPKGLFCFSHCKAESTADTGQADQLLSLGAAHGTSNRLAFGHVDRFGPTAMEVATAVNYDHLYVHIDETDGAAAALVGSIDLTSFDSGGFTLDQDDADPVAALVSYVAFGDAPAAPSFQYPQLERVARGVGRGAVTGGR